MDDYHLLHYFLKINLFLHNLNKPHNLLNQHNLLKYLHKLADRLLNNNDDDMNNKRQWSCHERMALLHGLCPE